MAAEKNHIQQIIIVASKIKWSYSSHQKRLFVSLIIFVLIFFGLSNSVSAKLSAARPESEDYKVKAVTTTVFNSASTFDQQLESNQFKKPAGPFVTPTVPIPEFSSIENMQFAFTAVRDRKHLHWLRMPESTRRVTYLYPTDGCFMRAALMNKNLKANRIKPLPKIYAFGNLNVKTRYAKSGNAVWYFHVALVARVGK